MRAAAILILAVLASGCVDMARLAPSVDHLVDVGGGGNFDVELLEQGRRVYVTRCTQCHAVVEIARYPRSDWHAQILPEMAKEARLDPSDERALSAYIEAALGAASVALVSENER